MSKYSEFFLLGSPEYELISEKLRLRKYGSWLAEEAWLRDEQNKKRAQFTLQVIHLARKIAKEKQIDEEEAFQILQGNTHERADILGEFADEAGNLMRSLPSSQGQLESLMTMFFRNRGEVLVGKKWTTCEDWTKEDTGKLPKLMLDATEQFMIKEDTSSDSSEEEGDGDEEAAPKEPS
jgi:hypothetical protein